MFEQLSSNEQLSSELRQASHALCGTGGAQDSSRAGAGPGHEDFAGAASASPISPCQTFQLLLYSFCSKVTPAWNVVCRCMAMRLLPIQARKAAFQGPVLPTRTGFQTLSRARHEVFHRVANGAMPYRIEIILI